MKIVIDIPEDAYKVPQSGEGVDWLNKLEYEFFKENPEAYVFVTSRCICNIEVESENKECR